MPDQLPRRDPGLTLAYLHAARHRTENPYDAGQALVRRDAPLTPLPVHADGTVCIHRGPAQAGLPDTPLCSAGVEVTHIRYNGRDIEVGQLAAALDSFGQAITAALTPIVTAYAEMARRLAASLSPYIRIIAAAAEQANIERAADLARTSPPVASQLPRLPNRPPSVPCKVHGRSRCRTCWSIH